MKTSGHPITGHLYCSLHQDNQYHPDLSVAASTVCALRFGFIWIFLNVTHRGHFKWTCTIENAVNRYSPLKSRSKCYKMYEPGLIRYQIINKNTALGSSGLGSICFLSIFCFQFYTTFLLLLSVVFGSPQSLPHSHTFFAAACLQKPVFMYSVYYYCLSINMNLH